MQLLRERKRKRKQKQKRVLRSTHNGATQHQPSQVKEINAFHKEATDFLIEFKERCVCRGGRRSPGWIAAAVCRYALGYFSELSARAENFGRIQERPVMSVADIAAEIESQRSRPGPAAVVLVVAERARRDGKYTAHHNAALVVDGSRQPFLDAARVLLAQGLDPSSRYVMRRSPDGPDALVSTLGKAAGLAVRENGRGAPVFCPWTPYGGPRGASP